MSIVMQLGDWWSLFVHFISLSLLAIGGAITTAPDMHRYLVDEQHWLTESQFTSSISLAQAAPGPNVMFTALMGWNVGLNASSGSVWWVSLAYALMGVAVCMVGIMLPSCSLTFVATQWAHRNRGLVMVRAFKAGMAPIVIALLSATGWLLISSHDNPSQDAPLWVLAAVSTVVVWRTRLHLLWLLGLGALLGAFGWV
jgi:chromate transporter